MRMLAAVRTVGVAEETLFVELTGEGIVGHQATDQWLTNSEQQFDRFGGLQETDNAWKHTQDTGFGTTWCQCGRRWLRIETAITRSLVRLEDCQLAFKAEDAPMHNGLIGDNCHVVEQIARGEVVGAIQNHIVVSDDACNIGLIQALDVSDDLYIRVQSLDGFTR